MTICKDWTRETPRKKATPVPKNNDKVQIIILRMLLYNIDICIYVFITQIIIIVTIGNIYDSS